MWGTGYGPPGGCPKITEFLRVRNLSFSYTEKTFPDGDCQANWGRGGTMWHNVLLLPMKLPTTFNAIASRPEEIVFFFAGLASGLLISPDAVM